MAFAPSFLGGVNVAAADVNGDGRDDLIVTPDDKVPFAVLSVGGFLGIDRKLVVVPFSLIVVRNDRMTLIGATKQSLEKLPEFHYQL